MRRPKVAGDEAGGMSALVGRSWGVSILVATPAGAAPADCRGLPGKQSGGMSGMVGRSWGSGFLGLLRQPARRPRIAVQAAMVCERVVLLLVASEAEG